MPAQVEKRIRLSPERAQYLRKLAQTHQMSEEQIIDQALDMLFSVADFLDAPLQRAGRLSRPPLASQANENMTQQAPSEEEFKTHLRSIGLLARQQHAPPLSSNETRSPVRIKGKPLSETVIEERR